MWGKDSDSWYAVGCWAETVEAAVGGWDSDGTTCHVGGWVRESEIRRCQDGKNWTRVVSLLTDVTANTKTAATETNECAFATRAPAGGKVAIVGIYGGAIEVGRCLEMHLHNDFLSAIVIHQLSFFR